MKTSEHDSRSNGAVQGLVNFGTDVLDAAAKLETSEAREDAATRHLQRLVIHDHASSATVARARLYAEDAGLIPHVVALAVVADAKVEVVNGGRNTQTATVVATVHPPPATSTQHRIPDSSTRGTGRTPPIGDDHQDDSARDALDLPRTAFVGRYETSQAGDVVFPVLHGEADLPEGVVELRDVDDRDSDARAIPCRERGREGMPGRFSRSDTSRNTLVSTPKTSTQSTSVQRPSQLPDTEVAGPETGMHGAYLVKNSGEVVNYLNAGPGRPSFIPPTSRRGHSPAPVIPKCGCGSAGPL